MADSVYHNPGDLIGDTRRTGIDPQRRFRIESTALLLLACGFVLLSQQFSWFKAFDRVLYDYVITTARAAQDENIVLVGIDDSSLAAYGPWPWTRDRQARLLRAVNRHAPDTVVLDVIYAGTTAHDEALIEAAAATKRLALPLMVEQFQQAGQHVEVLPFPDLLAHADTLGHVHVELDEDAIVRGTYLYQGVASPRWPHLMAALSGRPAPTCAQQKLETLFISKCAYVGVPFAGPPGTYPEVSARTLLDGGVDESLLGRALGGKTVIVGLTARGAGDWVPSPTGGDAGPMSGIEFNANLLSALRHDSTIALLPPWLLIVVGFCVVASCSVLLPRLRPKQMVVTTASLAAAPLAASIVLLAGFGLHAPLTHVAAATLLIYPVWSWRRHEIAWQFISGELDRIDAEIRDWASQGAPVGQKGDEQTVVEQLAHMLDARLTLDKSGPTVRIECQRAAPLSAAEQQLLDDAARRFAADGARAPGLPGEMLAAQIRRLESRAKEVREGRAVGLAGLGRMSNAVLIVSAIGEIHYMNGAAARMFGVEPASPRPLLEILDTVTPPLGQSWTDIMRQIVLKQAPVYFEGHLGMTPVFVAAEPLPNTASTPYAPFWVLTLSDLSAIRAAEAQREEALAFLSHDIRSPLTSVLALIRGSREQSQLLEDISRYTQKGLATSEQFLQLSRLQMQRDFERYDVSLEQVIHNAVEQVFFLSKDKSIVLRTEGLLDSEDAPDETEEGVWINGNGELLERALVNLLGNAIKYSQPRTEITVRLTVRDKTATISVEDQGPGIPSAEVEHIFDPFFRSAEPELAEQRGAGLGLRFVKTVAERHGGSVEVTSVRGGGSIFSLNLPYEADTGTQSSTTANT